MQISRQGQGYSLTMGIYTNAQVTGWKKVTEAVHAKDGKIMFLYRSAGSIPACRTTNLKFSYYPPLNIVAQFLVLLPHHLDYKVRIF